MSAERVRFVCNTDMCGQKKEGVADSSSLAKNRGFLKSFFVTFPKGGPKFCTSQFFQFFCVSDGLFLIHRSATQLQYYEVRDTLFGRNGVKGDVKRALELASICQHPEAQWLTEIFAGKDVKGSWEAVNVFRAQGNDNARAFCFRAVLADHLNDTRLKRAADMGFAFAEAHVGALDLTTDEQNFSFALRASLQGERDGFWRLGECYRDGKGCERDLCKAKENYLIAAKLNSVHAMNGLGYLFDESNPQHWHWRGLAASRGEAFLFLFNFGSVVDRFNSEPSLAPAVFMIGRALKGQINEEQRKIFGESREFDSSIAPANRAVAFFSNQCDAARAAVDTWCLMACRTSKVNRDIRKKIGMLIWEARELGHYEGSSADEATSHSKRLRLS